MSAPRAGQWDLLDSGLGRILTCFELRRLYSSCTFCLSRWLPGLGLPTRDQSVMAYLAGGVDDLGRKCLSLVNNFVTKGILNRGIVALDKVALAVLDGQG